MTVIAATSTNPTVNNNPWRPPQWADNKAPYMITVLTGPYVNDYYVLTPLRVSHELVLRRTEHPIQTGAAITDHAYVLPTKVLMEVGVSDAVDVFVAGMWGGSAASTSVNAFGALRSLVKTRALVSVTTRLHAYTNMLVESVSAEETSKTIAAGRFQVIFSELFIAGTQVATARPDTSASSSKGTVTSMPTLQQIQQMYGVLPNGMVPYTGYVGSITPTPAMNAGVANNGSTAIGAGIASSYSMPTGYQGALSAAGIP